MGKPTRAGLWTHYKIALLVTAFIIGLTGWLGSIGDLLPLIALAVIEVTFSFENAVINSETLSGMSLFWRRMFLTAGIILAVFVVRLVLPVVLVAVTAGDTLKHVLDIALHQPDIYAKELRAAYPVIAAFGGIFLLMIGLRFFGEQRDIKWLHKVEAPLAEFNQPWWVSLGGAGAGIVIIYLAIAPGNKRILVAAIAGAICFLVIKGASLLLLRKKLQSGDNSSTARGSAGFVQFLYLELLDASFSFDGVIAAFAITKKILLIAAGLGIGALFVRSITVHLLKQGTLAEYRYLVHGAHYAILALALMLIASIRVEIPEILTGLIGLAIIGLAFESSHRHNRRQANA